MLMFFLTLTSMVVVYFCIIYHMWHIKYFHEKIHFLCLGSILKNFLITFTD